MFFVSSVSGDFQQGWQNATRFAIAQYAECEMRLLCIIAPRHLQKFSFHLMSRKTNQLESSDLCGTTIGESLRNEIRQGREIALLRRRLWWEKGQCRSG
ncbi:MAG: hypothetical protein IKO55_04010, partial [Kiritimatiellae bacterium]|nr:hypothetical protein [Kiritimatiellia bacterium]